MERIIRPAEGFRGEATVPGDKSISHRALILGVLAQGETKIENCSPGRDVESTANCLRALGVEIEDRSGVTVVRGQSLCGLQPPRGILDAGNSGTTMRMLAGLLSGQRFQTTITGDQSLRRRPMDRVIEPLQMLGAQIESCRGRAPLAIQGGSLKGIPYELPIASSQVKSSILLAGLYASGQTTVIEPVLTRDHTERLLAHLGAAPQIDGRAITVGCGSPLHATELAIPGDLSAASFLMAAAVLIPNASICLRDVGINPTRTGFLDLLREMGAEIMVDNKREQSGEPWADLLIKSAHLRGARVGGAQISLMIDELPLLAVVATQAQGRTVIRNAAELRVKESDRIRAVAENLRRMGVAIEERPDGWLIEGPQRLKGARIDSFGDHRIAMAFAIAALVAEGETTIVGAEWADISFPGFFERLEGLAQ